MNLNAITASESTTTDGVNDATLMRDDFLKLLVAQMSNQDPLNPLDNAEFTAQLAQFSSLEQLFNVNKNLQDFQTLQSTLNNTEALSYLGREVQAEGNEVSLSGDSALIGFSLMDRADEVYLGIYNSVGELVRNEPLGKMDEGDQLFTWDGKDNNGIPVSWGIYTFDIAASAGDSDVEGIGYTTGKVDGISYEDGRPVLSVGGLKIDHDKVKTVK